jgi:arthrofactin-type cyclic lipopeptide synthetase C
MVQNGLLQRRSQPDVLRGVLRTFAAALRSQFTPRTVYLGPARLVLVDHPMLDREANRRRQEAVIERWRKWAPNLTYTHLGGNHMTILQPPHVQDLARVIEMGLSE